MLYKIGHSKGKIVEAQGHLNSGCGSAGRVVACDAIDPWFKTSYRQTFIYLEPLCTVSCIEKTKIMQKEARNGPFLKTSKLKDSIFLLSIFVAKHFSKIAQFGHTGCFQ